MIGLQRKPGGGFEVVRVKEQVFSEEMDMKHAKALRDSYDHQMASNIKRCQVIESDNEDLRQAVEALDKYIANPGNVPYVSQKEDNR